MIGERLRKAREARGITQSELAKLVGISVAHMSDYENSDRNASSARILEFCKALDVSADYLLGLVDMPKEYFKGDVLSPGEKEYLAAFRAGNHGRILELVSERMKSKK